MTLTLLLDLDDTLLGNRMDTFLPAYLNGLADCLAPYAEPARMLKALLEATQKMMANNDPTRTLKQVFDAHFYPTLGLEYEALQPPIHHFYTHEYTGLRQLTTPRPEAVRLVRTALQRGYRLVVATNPLFPAIAIHERLAWAGLPPEHVPFIHITTFDNSHFAKPNPAYYAEILAILGWPEGPVVMVGDDPERDIFPASQLGLPTYWLSNDQHNPGETSAPPAASGPLDALLPWLDATGPERLLPAYETREAITATLRATPAALSASLLAQPRLDWHFSPSPDDWNLTEIACHLRDAELRVNLPRLRQILREDTPFLSGVDTDSWADGRAYRTQDGAAALREFIQARLDLLILLEQTAPADWQRPARHAIFGPTHFQEICKFIAEHDRLHLRQIRRIFKREGSSEVASPLCPPAYPNQTGWV